MKHLKAGAAGTLTGAAKQLLSSPARAGHADFRTLVEPLLRAVWLSPRTASVWLPYRVEVYLRDGGRVCVRPLRQVGGVFSGWSVCWTCGPGEPLLREPAWADDTDSSPAALMELLRAVLANSAALVGPAGHP